MRVFACLLVALGCIVPVTVFAKCADATAVKSPGITIQQALEVPPGEIALPGLEKPLHTDGFCRITAVAAPTTDSDIHFEVWIPPDGHWNGKLLGVGNGGFAGSIGYWAMAAGLTRGYATVGSDTGHSGDQMDFGAGHPEKIIDWAYRGVHVTTEAAKLIVAAEQGRAPSHSYFQGCSTGGQQALSEAQRFPQDYDGIIAGAPGYDRIRLILGFLWSWAALHDDSGKPLLGPTQLSLLTHEVTARCDQADGLRDGLISDPRRCHFDPKVLACKSDRSDHCLTPQQIQGVQKVYAGAHNARTGAPLFPGWLPGTEEGWGAYLVNPAEPPRLGLFRVFAFHDPQWDWHNFDWDHDVGRVEAAEPYLSAVSRDLHEFRARGGRLLMYTGWADPVVPAANVITYFESVARNAGGSDRISDYFRFFAIPGMSHCGGGPGLNTFDPLPVLESWVEQNQAPDRIIASRSVDGHLSRSRPVCAYPKEARYVGHGSIDVPEGFICHRR